MKNSSLKYASVNYNTCFQNSPVIYPVTSAMSFLSPLTEMSVSVFGVFPGPADYFQYLNIPLLVGGVVTNNRAFTLVRIVLHSPFTGGKNWNDKFCRINISEKWGNKFWLFVLEMFENGNKRKKFKFPLYVGSKCHLSQFWILNW